MKITGFLNIGIASALLPAKITRRKRIQKNFNVQNDDPESFSSDYSSFVPVTFNDFDGPVVSSVSSSDLFEDPVFDRDEMCTDPHDAICEPEEQTCTAEMKKEDNCSCDCVQEPPLPCELDIAVLVDVCSCSIDVWNSMKSYLQEKI